ncbi:hypothetical protein ACHHYP_02232 [Achlya hypogyna]|uniref:Uncharacterized protein n=1 Tax=Achlya hypogyna TaxID=1202772 RepID=A0A1V9ZS71_ACHHY|nr:hypothetical protein ACHHYP_02232 [Achlya hypogyna]
MLHFAKPSCACARRSPFEPSYTTATFPHACPGQSPTRDHGKLAVQFELPHLDPAAVTQHLVFLRFEPHDSLGSNDDLQIGDEVPCASIVDHVRSLSHPSGEWLPSDDYVLDQASGVAHCTYAPPHPFGWYISCVEPLASATLAAYLFLRTMRAGHAVLRVLGCTKSPVFTIGRHPTPMTSIDTSIATLLTFVSQMPPGRGGALVNRQVQQRLLRPLLQKPEFEAHRALLAEHYLGDDAYVLPITGKESQLLTDTVNAGMSPLEATSVSVVLGLFDPELVKQLQALCLQDTDCLLDKASLVRLYEAWKALLEEYVNQWLRRSTRYTSHEQLVRDIRTVAAIDVSLHTFETFVAQLREYYIAKDQPGPTRESWHLRPPLSPFSGRWLYDVHQERPACTVSILPMTQWFTMAFCFQQHLNDSVLYVRSDLAIHSTIWSTYHLDNCHRVAQVFPNGAATIHEWSASWLHGDYVGTVEHGVVSITFYCWPLRHHQPAYLAHLQITAPSTRRLQYRWRISTCAVVDGADFVTMTAERRHESLRGEEHHLLAVNLLYQLVPPCDTFDI